MNLAVKLFADVSEKHAGVPDSWPAEIIELGESSSLPPGPWQLMTMAQYEVYRDEHMPEYMAWEEAYYALIEEKEKKKQGIRDQIAYGAKVIEEFRYYALDLTGDQVMTLVNALEKVIQLLQVGFLAQAATILNSISGVDILDQPFDVNTPDGETVKGHFVSLITSGF